MQGTLGLLQFIVCGFSIVTFDLFNAIKADLRRFKALCCESLQYSMS